MQSRKLKIFEAQKMRINREQRRFLKAERKKKVMVGVYLADGILTYAIYGKLINFNEIPVTSVRVLNTI